MTTSTLKSIPENLPLELRFRDATGRITIADLRDFYRASNICEGMAFDAFPFVKIAASVRDYSTLSSAERILIIDPEDGGVILPEVETERTYLTLLLPDWAPLDLTGKSGLILPFYQAKFRQTVNLYKLADSEIGAMDRLNKRIFGRVRQNQSGIVPGYFQKHPRDGISLSVAPDLDGANALMVYGGKLFHDEWDSLQIFAAAHGCLMFKLKDNLNALGVVIPLDDAAKLLMSDVKTLKEYFSGMLEMNLERNSAQVG